MKTIVLLLFSSILVMGQSDTIKLKRHLINVGSGFSFGKNGTQNEGVLLGYTYKFKSHDKVHTELGANILIGAFRQNLDYKYKGVIYDVKTSDVIVDFGVNMVKEYTFGKKSHVEWISHLGVSSLFFNSSQFPNEPEDDENNGNTIKVKVDTKNISTFQFGQGLRYSHKNMGLQLVAYYTPYHLLNSKSTENVFNSFRVQTGIIYNF